jgi:hypothetical protein
MTRAIFIGFIPAALLALFKGELFKGPVHVAAPTGLVLPHNVSLSRIIPAWSSDVLEEWIPARPSVSAWRFDQGGLQLLDTLLFGSAPAAIAGKLAFEFSLEETGRARLLLGSDRAAQNYFFVEMVSKPTKFELRPWLRTASGGLSPVDKVRVIDRRNWSKPVVEISFDSSALNVKVNGQPRDWPGLGVGPGHIGLSGRAKDGFRVYHTEVDLTT